MNLDQFIASLSEKDLAKINEKFNQLHHNIPSYTFSEITFNDLEKIVELKAKLNYDKFDGWFNNEIKIDKSDSLFLKNLLHDNIFYLERYTEEDLKMKFISQILSRIHFTDMNKEIRDFYDRKLTYKTKEFILTGRTDCMIAKGDFYPKIPYFFIQEYKPSKGGKDPEPQLLAELIATLELNKDSIIKGIFIVGINWNFVILEKLSTYKYQYFVSEVFNSAKLEDLQKIYTNLLYIKQEIFKLNEKYN